MPRLHRACVVGAFAAMLLSAAEGYAQETSPTVGAMASELYGQAIERMKRGDHAAACPMLEEVVRLVPDGVNGRFMLAYCYEEDGRLASAWSTYLLTEAKARDAKRNDRQEQARRRAEALQPRLARLTVIIPEEVRSLPGLRVTWDEIPLGQVQWDVAFPVDRGVHRLAATAEGRLPWEAQVDVAADGQVGSVEIGELAESEPAQSRLPAVDPPERPAPSSAPRRPATTVAPAAPRDEASGFWSAQRAIGVGLGGVGLLGIAIGAVAGGAAIVKLDSSETYCEGNTCDEQGIALRGQSILSGTISTASFIAGGVALVGGAWVFATAPRGERPRGAQVVVGPQWVGLRGRW